MKKLFALATIFALALAACDQPTDKDKPGAKFPNLTVRNESSFVLTDVKFSGIPFASSGNDLPVSAHSVKPLTADDVNKAGYITFTRKDIGISCRTEAISITDQDYTFTFLDTTVVEELANNSNKKRLDQITFLSTVAVEYDGSTVVKGDEINLGESVVNYTKPNDFVLKNNGVGKLLLTGSEPVKIEGEAGVFSVIQQPSSSEIVPNGSLTFKINFKPVSNQTYTATVTISSNDQNGDFVFTVTASGVSPKPIASIFYGETEIPQDGTIVAGEVLITMSQTITVIIKNSGNAVLEIDRENITITGTDAEAFTRRTTPAVSILAGAQTSFVIEGSPIKQGENNAVLTIPTNDTSRNPAVVHLKMTGRTPVIGDEGPGGGIIFYAQGGQFKECSVDLGLYDWSGAVTAAINYRGGGFSDWRLPDQEELLRVAEKVHDEGLGDYLDELYWSSSDAGNEAVAVDFDTKGEGVTAKNKTSSARAFAVRVFYL